MSPYRRNVLVGVVVLGALGVLGWMILQFAGKAATFFLTTGTHIVMKAERADGVSEGSAVMFRGVNIGRVMGVRLGRDNRFVYIDLLVDPKGGPPLPGNLHGIIRASGLLGTNASIFLELNDNSPNPPQLKAEDELEGRFNPDFTALAEDFRQREVIRHVDEAVARASTLLDSANKIVSDPKLREDIQTSVANIRAAAENANRVTANMEKFSGSLDDLSKQTSSTVTEVRTTVVAGRKHMDDISRQLNDRMEQVAQTLEHFQSIATKIDKGDGTAGKLVNDPKLYESLADAAKELNLTVADLRRLVDQWEQEGVHLKLGK